MDAQRRNAKPLRFRHSQSLAKRRHRLSHAMVRSTIQRLSNPTNLPASDRLTISTLICSQTLLELSALIAAVSVKLQQKRKQAEQCAHREYAAIAILDIGGMDNGVQQQALCIYQDMALLALELFARIIAMRIDRDPPFSALLTLWLSMMAAVGLALRSANWGHST